MGRRRQARRRPGSTGAVPVPEPSSPVTGTGFGCRVPATGTRQRCGGAGPVRVRCRTVAGMSEYKTGSVLDWSDEHVNERVYVYLGRGQLGDVVRAPRSDTVKLVADMVNQHGEPRVLYEPCECTEEQAREVGRVVADKILCAREREPLDPPPVGDDPAG